MYKILNFTGKVFSIIMFLALIIVEIQVSNEGLLGNWSVSNLSIIISTQEALAFGGDLSCADLSNCEGSASCNSAGTVDVCQLNCEGGGTVTCVNPGGGGDKE